MVLLSSKGIPLRTIGILLEEISQVLILLLTAFKQLILLILLILLLNLVLIVLTFPINQFIIKSVYLLPIIIINLYQHLSILFLMCFL